MLQNIFFRKSSKSKEILDGKKVLVEVGGAKDANDGGE